MPRPFSHSSATGSSPTECAWSSAQLQPAMTPRPTSMETSLLRPRRSNLGAQKTPRPCRFSGRHSRLLRARKIAPPTCSLTWMRRRLGPRSYRCLSDTGNSCPGTKASLSTKSKCSVFYSAFSPRIAPPQPPQASREFCQLVTRAGSSPPSRSGGSVRLRDTSAGSQLAWNAHLFQTLSTPPSLVGYSPTCQTSLPPGFFKKRCQLRWGPLGRAWMLSTGCCG
mmetsp:Transcript_42448/g.104540  ORF Transcript_42448/g.104540 Transcript_42448/m.104540 type:complete len:223 (-) Transcript_42448:465-1133(-)